MFTPQYSLTGKLLADITQSERLYGQLEGLKIPQKLELNLKRKNLIQSAYASNKIEGNPLTLPEVTNLLLDDRVPASRDEKEVANYFHLLAKLAQYQDRDLSVNLVEELHDRLFTGLEKSASQIRNAKVVVGKYSGEKGTATLKVKHEPPFHKRRQIAQSLTELFAWLKEQPALPTIIRTGVFHHHFVFIHPFEDGNGRICRALTALIFLKDNYQVNKYFILDDYYDIDRIAYSDALHSADRGDKTRWLEYFAEGVKHSLKSALSRYQNALQSLRIKERPSPKERRVLEIMRERPELTSTDLAQQLNISRQQAHNLLSSLVTKGLVERKGTTKSSYYKLRM